MPKIAPHYFNVPLDGSDRQRDNFTYKADVTVNSKGEFSISIPANLAPACEELAEKQEWNNVTVHEGRTDGQGNGKWVVRANDKTRAVALVSAAARIWAKAETTTEYVIVYAHDAEGRYMVGPNGEVATDLYDIDKNFYPNTSRKSPTEYRQGWQWSESKRNHFGEKTTFKFGIGAKVYEKITTKRSTGTTIRYELWYGGENGEKCDEDCNDHFARRTYAQRLNSLDLHFSIGTDYANGDKYPEIPYTEEAARFFFEAIMSLCSISERIKNFFGDRTMLQKAIESRASLMLGSGR
jgi:hypothetical protein